MPDRPAQLSKTDIEVSLDQLPGWAFNPAKQALQKEFRFGDFKEAWAFMQKVAVCAEKLDHHPEWFNVYSRVDVMLRTHDVAGVTSLDMQMARAMNDFAG